MSDMVERVSILLRRSERDQTDSGYRELARDVLREMREPTEEMQKARVAPDDADLPVKVLGEYLDYWTAEAVWHAMIDAALKDSA